MFVPFSTSTSCAKKKINWIRFAPKKCLPVHYISGHFFVHIIDLCIVMLDVPVCCCLLFNTIYTIYVYIPWDTKDNYLYYCSRKGHGLTKDFQFSINKSRGQLILQSWTCGAYIYIHSILYTSMCDIYIQKRSHSVIHFLESTWRVEQVW